ncbi:hypothetical protein [Pirellula sp. SH-Sr6A]|uniref:hypothetical protein n=1 Tax=Pirellula sp. SH-Sr6A TaxID=1632865 RepID=UPI0011BA869C|nr:hypothetical protein [Pirellula sp. SH-Sr6A]
MPSYAAWSRSIQLGTTSLVALVLLVLLPSWRQQTVLAPGPLSHAHAQLLTSQGKTGSPTIDAKSRCAACHPNAATESDPSMLRAVHAVEHPIGVGPQSQLCLQCHAETMPNAIAGTPHDLIGKDLQALVHSVSQPAQSDRSSNTMECSQCHREHQGSNEDLRSITSTRCQSCHRKTFDSFANGHPEFANYPSPVPRSIPFDHGKHRDEYFSKKQASFDCKSCHQSDDKSGVVGNIYRSVSFERACASCHLEPLQSASSDGTLVLQLPSFQRSLLEQAGLELGPWPDSASQIMDGEISPLWEALIASQPEGSMLLKALPSSKRVQDIDVREKSQLELVVKLASTMRDALKSWTKDGQSAFRKVIASDTDALFAHLNAMPQPTLSLGENPNASHVASLTLNKPTLTPRDQWLDRIASGIPTDLIRDAYRRWFASGTQPPPVSTRIRQPSPSLAKARMQPPGDDDLLLPDNASLLPADGNLLEGPSTLGPTAQGPNEEPLKTWQHMPFGGWMLDDARVALIYIPQPHADPWLSRWLEWQSFRSRSSTQPTSPPLDSYTVFSATMRLEKQCVQCHNIGIDGLANNPISNAAWKIQQRSASIKRITRFDHTPHLTILSLRNCETCHVLAPPAHAMGGVGSQGWSEQGRTVHHEFQTMNKADCARCHQRQSAGDQCTQCHHYHVHQFEREVSTDLPLPMIGGREVFPSMRLAR